MEAIVPAYKASGERRYRETSGLYFEDFEPGDVFEHRPGRTVVDADNTYSTLLTLNIQPIHFDAAYAVCCISVIPRAGRPWGSSQSSRRSLADCV
jgi:itaconyl-CoA hydratase